MPSVIPQRDPDLVALKQYILAFASRYRAAHGHQPNNNILVTMGFDTVARGVIVGPSEPYLPQTNQLWFNHQEILECAANVPSPPLGNTWVLKNTKASLWTNSVVNLMPPNDVALLPLPSDQWPRLQGVQLQERMYTYGDAVDPMEVVNKQSLDRVADSIAGLHVLLDNLRIAFEGEESTPEWLSSGLATLILTGTPTLAQHAVNLAYLQSVVTPMMTNLNQTGNRINALNALYLRLKDSINNLKVLMQQVQNPELLVRTSGARFNGKVYLPIDEVPNEDDQAVAWRWVKSLINDQETVIHDADPPVTSNPNVMFEVDVDGDYVVNGTDCLYTLTVTNDELYDVTVTGLHHIPQELRWSSLNINEFITGTVTRTGQILNFNAVGVPAGTSRSFKFYVKASAMDSNAMTLRRNINALIEANSFSVVGNSTTTLMPLEPVSDQIFIQRNENTPVVVDAVRWRNYNTGTYPSRYATATIAVNMSNAVTPNPFLFEAKVIATELAGYVPEWDISWVPQRPGENAPDYTISTDRLSVVVVEDAATGVLPGTMTFRARVGGVAVPEATLTITEV